MSAVHRVQCLVVGAGVVGLAVARELARRGRSVVIVEAQSAYGTGTSSRNSEVIHAGIYYPKDSLKARLCVRGRELLYAYCAQRGVAHRRLGKWIVATRDAQRPALEALARAAADNGVSDVRFLDADHAMREEPELRCVAALESPSSGIIDSHGFMLSLLGEAEDHGATLALRTTVTSVGRAGAGLRARFAGAGDALDCDWIVNCAGLDAPRMASMIDSFPASAIPPVFYAKGSYFSLSGQKAPFSRLIYPVPEPGGLGVHLTLDMSGQARFGPDVEWVEHPDYTVDPTRAARFYPVVRTYWPGLRDGALQPAYAGMRPKISGPGQPAADFRVEGPGSHGVEGVVHLFGIESPGLTASLALAEYVADLMR